MSRVQIALALVLALALVGAGVALDRYLLTDPPRPEQITSKPAERQGDGSLVLAREASANPAPARHALPSGIAEERRVSVTVKPKPGRVVQQPAGPYSLAGGAMGASACECDPVTVDLSLIRDAEGGRRVVASSPDGEVVAGLDVPIEPALLPPPVRRHALGIAYKARGSFGTTYTHDLGRLRLGALLLKPEGRKAEAWATAAFTF